MDATTVANNSIAITATVSPARALRPATPPVTPAPTQAPAPEPRVLVGETAPTIDITTAALSEAPRELYGVESPSEGEVTDAMIDLAINAANQRLSMTSFRLSHSVHEATNTILVRVYDTDTDELLREVPPESRLDSLARILELQGMLFNGRS